MGLPLSVARQKNAIEANCTLHTQSIMDPQTTSAITCAWPTVVDYADKLLNSNFTVSLVGALAGAYAGAIAAQRIAERSRFRDETLREIRNVNAAIMAAFTICNTALSLKKQLVGPMYTRFERAKEDYLKFIEQRRTGQRQGNAPYAFEADLQTFMIPAMPIDTLKALLFEKVNAQDRALALISLIDNAATGLRQSSGKRESLIDMFKANPPPPDVLPLHYFGQKLPSGHTHREYADIVGIVHSYTDDLIFFSADLCSELSKYGKALRTEFIKRHKGAPTITEPDFDGPRKTGLFPKEENYSSWRSWIIEKPAVKQGKQ